MVPQLWIWREGHLVVTAYSMAKPGDNDQNPKYDQKFPLKPQTHLPLLHVALLLAHHVEAFGEQTKSANSETFPSPLDMFESAMLACIADVDEYLNSPSSSADKFREKRLIHSIADIRDELVMIGDILQQQKEILEEFLSDMHIIFDKAAEQTMRKNAAETSRDVKYFKGIVREAEEPEVEEPEVEEPEFRFSHLEFTPEERYRTALAETLLNRYQARIKKIDRDAERIEKSISDKLETKRTHASIQDAHNSLVLSMTVVGFTVITVIFAPLAFLTALFALDVEGFDKLKVTLPLKNGTVPNNDDQDAVRVYSSRKLAGIFSKCYFSNH
jgi:hypothetical protein